jgi:hypothetical protein
MPTLNCAFRWTYTNFSTFHAIQILFIAMQFLINKYSLICTCWTFMALEGISTKLARAHWRWHVSTLPKVTSHRLKSIYLLSHLNAQFNVGYWPCLKSLQNYQLMTQLWHPLQFSQNRENYWLLKLLEWQILLTFSCSHYWNDKFISGSCLHFQEDSNTQIHVTRF